jgi:hypothetical protein
MFIKLDLVIRMDFTFYSRFKPSSGFTDLGKSTQSPNKHAKGQTFNKPSQIHNQRGRVKTFSPIGVQYNNIKFPVIFPTYK